MKTLRMAARLRPQVVSRIFCALLVLLLCSVTPCQAQGARNAPVLDLGDAAPALTYSQWWGSPPADFYKGKICVIDFWATWCGPCREALPHLNEMAKKYADKGVTFVAVNIWDTGQTKTVEEFINRAPYKDFKLAWALDKGGKYGVSQAAWMRAAGQNGIPTTFIIAANRIAWIGHPMQAESVIERLLNGSYDLQKEKERKIGEEQLKQIRPEYQAALAAKNWNKAAELYQKQRQAAPILSDQIDLSWLSALVNIKKDYDAANNFARNIGGKDYYNQAATLTEMVSKLAMIPQDDDLDSNLLLGMLKRIRELSGDKTRGFLYSVEARSYAAQGNYTAAIKAQEKYMGSLPLGLLPQAQAKLDEYRANAGK